MNTPFSIWKFRISALNKSAANTNNDCSKPDGKGKNEERIARNSSWESEIAQR